jgi:protocatechuate 3,4-dioxygenase beta subunit
MENDDQPIGRILSRREALSLLGLSGASLLAACAPQQSGATQPGRTAAPTNTTAAAVTPASTPSEVVQATTVADTGSLPTCVVRPELTEGPYYVDVNLDRSDVRTDTSTGVVEEGAELALTFRVSQIAAGSCAPLEGAVVEIWHCDADGLYSGVADPGFDTSGQNFLRGFQTTDSGGLATFVTVYPGWYPGRCVHIHFKVHHDSSEASRVFTSQLFFDDTFSDQVLTQAPYASRGQRNTLNSQDNIYQDELLVTVAQAGSGYAATFDIGLEM